MAGVLVDRIRPGLGKIKEQVLVRMVMNMCFVELVTFVFTLSAEHSSNCLIFSYIRPRNRISR